ncbi:MAG: 3-deoxy-7-phosphoheptulonate synthase [Acidobacteriota bacterium]|nr:3-deoxy-7-phosphoheptulonate synthase [Acidobacteriota bacterium]MDH3523782.1 3-deoxy-7-phosphoheptulonate synthase [Acidobacteriota bacterium]
MLVVMRMEATASQVEAVVEAIEASGLKAHPIPGAQRTAIGITGNLGVVEPTRIESLPGVLEVLQVSHPYKLVSREFRAADTIVEVGGVAIGGPDLVLIAGPCSVESYERTLGIARRVKAAGARLLRGGAFKPRTSPYSFQGLGREGLEILARVRDEVGLPVVTEALDIDVIDEVAEHADMVQIGARNMQNYTLLKRAGRCGRPVLLKRGMYATLTELLLAAEYILDQGNGQVVLCERGIRTFADHSRNTLDVALIPAVERISHLPIIADPSHAAGRRDKVLPLSLAAVAAGADGLMIEVHDAPEAALSDGLQALLPERFEELVAEVRALAAVLGREVAAYARHA